MRERDGVEKRKPLEWQERVSFTEGRVVGQIQAAETGRGTIYSVRFGRQHYQDPSKFIPFLEPRDIAALRLVVDQVDDYLRETRTEDVRNRFAGGRARREYV